MNNLTYLTLIITYQCRSRCAHCCIGAGPDHHNWMTPAEADSCLKIITEHNKIRHMTLIGGEALLNLDLTLTIGKLALARGIPKVEIDTGSSWAVDDEYTEQVISRILEAGLSIGAISVDAFHQQHTPPGRVLRVLQSARKQGLDLQGIATLIQPEDPTNKWDRETFRLIDWFGQHGFKVDTAPLILQGRAVNLARYHNGKRKIPSDRCKGVYFFATEDFRNPGGIQIDSLGSVMLEHGICIGNTHRMPLADILAEYNADTHPIFSVLRRKGPFGLTKLPQASGFRLRDDGYIDKCHLCQEIRTYLLPFFPNILGPEHYYPDILK